MRVQGRIPLRVFLNKYAYGTAGQHTRLLLIIEVRARLMFVCLQGELCSQVAGGGLLEREKGKRGGYSEYCFLTFLHHIFT